MGVASLVTGFSKWLYHKNELIVWNDFVHVGANSGKQKVHSVIFRWVWPFSSWGSKSLVFSEWVFELSWFFAWQMWYNGFCLDQHRTLYLWLKCYSTAVLLVGPLAAARRVLWNRVCPSFHPAIFLDVFLELDHLISLNFSMVLETLIKLCVTDLDILEKLFLPPRFWK